MYSRTSAAQASPLGKGSGKKSRNPAVFPRKEKQPWGPGVKRGLARYSANQLGYRVLQFFTGRNRTVFLGGICTVTWVWDYAPRALRVTTSNAPKLRSSTLRPSANASLMQSV